MLHFLNGSTPSVKALFRRVVIVNQGDATVCGEGGWLWPGQSPGPCTNLRGAYTGGVSFEQLKREVALLSGQEQVELIAYTLRLRHAQDADYRCEVADRLHDADKAHWLTPDEFERRLDTA
jgi:hypothetical protein